MFKLLFLSFQCCYWWRYAGKRSISNLRSQFQHHR